jgi:hypothetical protein
VPSICPQDAVAVGEQPAEDARHEPRRCGRAVAAGELDRLVHRHRAGNVGVEELERGDPQHRPVGRGHPRHPPVLAAGVELRVDRRSLRQHPFHDRAGEVDERGRPQPALQEALEPLRAALRIHLELVERLQGDLAGAAAAGHEGVCPGGRSA